MNKNRFISDKIKKLQSEGKPQDQAIAIALNMYREGGENLPSYRIGGVWELPVKDDYNANLQPNFNTTPKPTQEDFSTWNNSFNNSQVAPREKLTPFSVTPKSFKQVETALPKAEDPTMKIKEDMEVTDTKYNQPINFANPYGGVDLETSAFLFGNSLQSGDSLMTGLSGAKLGLGLFRTGMAGYSAGKDRNRVLSDAKTNRRNSMTGAKTPVFIGQEGGQMMNSQMQDQIIQAVQQMIQQGIPPQQILQELVNQGISEQEAIQIIQSLIQPPQMQQGGMFEQQEVPEQMANAEIEDGEYVNDSQGVKYAEGEKHSNGGMAVNLEDGAQVLSDYKKIGKELAKQFSEQLNLKLKPTDTFATVLDKYNSKSGFDTTLSELEKLQEKLKKQEKTVKDESTLALNQEVIGNQAKDKIEELSQLDMEQKEVFQILFSAQENMKAQEPNQTPNFMKNGGTVRDLMMQYNISEEQARNLIPNAQAGLWNINPTQPFDPNYRPEGDMSNAQYWEQQATNRAITDVQGSLQTYTPQEKELIKQHYAKFIKDPSTLQQLNQAIEADQLVFNQGMLEMVRQGKAVPVELQKNNQGNTFGGLSEEAFNKYLYKGIYEQQGKGKYDPTNREHNEYVYDVVAPALQARGIQWDGAPFTGKNKKGSGIINNSQPGFVTNQQGKVAGIIDLDKYRNIQDRGQKQLIANKYGITVEQLDNASKDITNKTLRITPQGIIATPESAPVMEGVDEKMEFTDPSEDTTEKSRKNMLLLPDQTPMMPWGMLAPTMTTQTVYAPKYNEVDPTQQLAEIQRGSVGAQRNFEQLSDSQRALAGLSLNANVSDAQNKVMSETERFNATARERNEGAEAQQKTQQSQANVVALQNYQQLLGNELESNEADWRNWYNRVQANQMNNWQTVNTYNRANALNPDIQFDGSQYIVQNYPTFDSEVQRVSTPTDTKKTKKKSVARFGGTKYNS